jgi:CheY-like chemotaxis protein
MINAEASFIVYHSSRPRLFMPTIPSVLVGETLLNNWFLAAEIQHRRELRGQAEPSMIRNHTRGTESMKDFGNEQPLVLVIDDEQGVLDAVRGVLSQANLACRCCATCEEALATAQAAPPDLILCDANLQGTSGLDLYEQIRQQPGLEGVPVMFLSGAQLPDIIRRSHANGGIYCLRKPFDPAVLIELIDQALGVPEA